MGEVRVAGADGTLDGLEPVAKALVGIDDFFTHFTPRRSIAALTFRAQGAHGNPASLRHLIFRRIAFKQFAALGGALIGHEITAVTFGRQLSATGGRSDD